MNTGFMDYRTCRRIPDMWVDWPTVWSFLILCAMGLLMVASASMEFAAREQQQALYFLKKQFVFMLIAAAAGICVYFTAPDYWFRNADKVFWLTFFLLLLVLLPDVGKEVKGSRRWLDLVWFTVQPSEIAKLALIICLARYIDRHRQALHGHLWQSLKPLAIVTLFCIPILYQPDYGAAATLMAITFAMLFLAGIKLRFFLLLIAAGISLFAILALWEDYRVSRIKAFLNPWSDPYDSGYQLVQSMIAISRGSWWGEGLGNSVQKLFYLPEVHTDFIFSVIAEELGFIGVLLVVGAYLCLVLRCFAIARRAGRQGLCAGAFLVYGIGVWVGLQAFGNIAVAMGSVPTTGTTLPLISVGGSSLVTVFVALAMTQRIRREALLRDAVLVRLYESRKINALR